jgi:hypothetical protein
VRCADDACHGEQSLIVTDARHQAHPAGRPHRQAADGAKRSRALLRGAGGKRITLSDLRVSCAVPPIASACPVDRASTTGGAETARLHTTPYAPVVVVTTVGS